MSTSSVPYPDEWKGSRLGTDPQGLFPGRCSSYAEPGDLCSWCGEPADHESPEGCDPADVRERRDEDRMHRAGL